MTFEFGENIFISIKHTQCTSKSILLNARMCYLNRHVIFFLFLKCSELMCVWSSLTLWRRHKIDFLGYCFCCLLALLLWKITDDNQMMSLMWAKRCSDFFIFGEASQNSFLWFFFFIIIALFVQWSSYGCSCTPLFMNPYKELISFK